MTHTTRVWIATTLSAFSLLSAIWIAQAEDPPFATNTPIVEPAPTEPRPVSRRIAPPWPQPIPPRPFPVVVIGREVELQLASQRATVEIDGATARTKLVQTFRNPTSRTIEGTYLFPLPTGAAVSGFAMTVGGKRIEAEILPSARAREIYEGIVAKQRDPAILEFADRNTLKARIFPIAAGAEQIMEIEYSQTLGAANGGWKYSLPLRLPIGGLAQRASVDIRVRPKSASRAIYSPSHTVENKSDGDSWRISGEWTSAATGEKMGATTNQNDARDFVLYGTQSSQSVGLNLWTQKVAGEDPYFMLLAAPDPNSNKAEIAAKDVVFCFDTSGSMSGEKIDQARKALLNLLGNLNPSDRFNIVTFSSDVNPFRDALVVANAGNIAAARAFANDIKAVGGTNINDALQTSLKMFANSGRTQQLIFMTDGQPTVGETDIDTIVKNTEKSNHLSAFNGIWDDTGTLPNRARIFVFGVGFDVNTKLLDELAEDNGGTSDYVLPNENIESVVGSLYAKIAFPVMSNLRLDWGGASVYDVYPKTLPTLFKGTTTVVFGRIKNTSSTRVSLSGVINDKTVTIAGIVAGGENELVPRLWATRKVGFLLDDARRAGREPAEEVRDEIIALSKKFGIVTPLTAALITEDEPRLVGRDDTWLGNAQNGAPRSRASSDSAAGDITFGSSSGENAVRAAKSTNELRTSTRIKEKSDLRYAAGKSFVLRDGVWTDTTFNAKQNAKIEVVKFASPAYFALSKDANVAKWLGVAQRVLVVIGKRVVKIEE